MIAVTAASGQLGRLVIDALLTNRPAEDIIAVVRSPEKAADLAAKGVHVRHGDYADPASLETALSGVDRLLVISSNDIGNRVAQHTAAFDAASKAGVGHLVYTSVLHADDLSIGLTFEHPPTEAALKKSGMVYTILRNGWYTENFADLIAGAVSGGVVPGASGDGVVSAAARKDYAEAAANVLMQPAGHENKTYELAGDTGFTKADLAAKIAVASGRDIDDARMSQAELETLLASFGLPAPFAAAIAEADTAIAAGKLEENGQTLSALIGRPTTPIDALISEVLG